MNTTYSVTVDWPSIHAACQAVDALRGNLGGSYARI